MQTDAEVAAKLTKAQRQRLLGIMMLSEARQSWASKWGSLSWRSARASTSALFAAGLIFENMYGDAALTVTGTRVAQHLKQENAKCRIGSCQRHGKCMYAPCRSIAQENAK